MTWKQGVNNFLGASCSKSVLRGVPERKFQTSCFEKMSLGHYKAVPQPAVSTGFVPLILFFPVVAVVATILPIFLVRSQDVLATKFLMICSKGMGS